MRWYIIILARNKCFWCVEEKAYALLCTKQRPKWREKKYTRHKHNNITPRGINNLQQCRKKCGENAHKVNIEAKWKLLIGAKCETLLCIENICTMSAGARCSMWRSATLTMLETLLLLIFFSLVFMVFGNVKERTRQSFLLHEGKS